MFKTQSTAPEPYHRKQGILPPVLVLRANGTPHCSIKPSSSLSGTQSLTFSNPYSAASARAASSPAHTSPAAASEPSTTNRRIYNVLAEDQHQDVDKTDVRTRFPGGPAMAPLIAGVFSNSLSKFFLRVVPEHIFVVRDYCESRAVVR